MEPVARALTRRTVHVKMYPTATNLSERREVLRVLERFGEVTMFRSLKYHPTLPTPNAFLAMYSTEAAAREILKQAVLRYRLIKEPPPPPALGTPSVESILYPNSPPNVSAEEQEEKSFELNISSTAFDHIDYLTKKMTNPLYGPYVPVPHWQSPFAALLENLIPPSIASPALRDWETDSLIPREIESPAFETDEKHGLVGSSVSRRFAIRNRIRKEASQPRVMKGLKALREEFEQSQASKDKVKDDRSRS